MKNSILVPLVLFFNLAQAHSDDKLVQLFKKEQIAKEGGLPMSGEDINELSVLSKKHSIIELAEAKKTAKGQLKLEKGAIASSKSEKNIVNTKVDEKIEVNSKKPSSVGIKNNEEYETAKIELSEPRLIKEDKVEIKSMPDTLPVKKGSLSDEKNKMESRGGVKTYIPPVRSDDNENGFFTERDSFNIVKKAVSFNDAITVQMCYAAGVSIHFDDTIETTIQKAVADDNGIYFSVVRLENKRGVFVKMLKPIPKGRYVDNSLRLFRQSDDRAYLINIVGTSCPDGIIKYPKVIYLKNKENTLTNGRDIKGRDILPPEDTIIEVSKGYLRTNKVELKVYDMITSSGSNSIILGVELNGKFNEGDYEFAALDNQQVNRIDLSVDYLSVQSQKSSIKKGKELSRFRIVVPSIDKTYITRRKEFYLLFLNNKSKEYEYVRVNLLPYFNSLKNRGFDL